MTNLQCLNISHPSTILLTSTPTHKLCTPPQIHNTIDHHLPHTTNLLSHISAADTTHPVTLQQQITKTHPQFFPLHRHTTMFNTQMALSRRLKISKTFYYYLRISVQIYDNAIYVLTVLDRRYAKPNFTATIEFK